MDRLIKGGTADVSIHVFIIDSTDGTPETGVVFNTAGIDFKYRREGAATVNIVPVDLATPLLTDPHLDAGFLEVGYGEYRLDLPDAACAAGVKHVGIIGTVTGMIVLPVEIQLVAFDPDDTVRAGLTALPNAAAEAAGGLYTRGAGAGQINQPANGAIDANAVSAVAAFFQDCFTVDSGEVSGAEVGGSLILEIAKVVWDRVLSGGTHNIATSAGRRLRQLDAAFEVTSGTAQAGGVATITLAAGESAVNDIFRGDRVIIVGGTGQGEHELITAYNGGTKVATVADTWVTQPDATSEYSIVPASVNVETVQHTIQTAGDLAALTTTVDTVVDAIKTVTDALPEAGALTTIGTDTARLTAVRAAILTDWINGGRLDLLLDAVIANIALLDDGIVRGTVDTVVNGHAPTTTEFQADDITEATADHYIGRIVTWLTGALTGQSTDITDYANVGGIGQFTVTAMTDAPANNDTFKMT